MRHEAEELLNAIAAHCRAHVGDSDDAEIDAAFEMGGAALVVLRKVAAVDPEIAELVNKFDRESACVYSE